MSGDYVVFASSILKMEIQGSHEECWKVGNSDASSNAL